MYVAQVSDLSFIRFQAEAEGSLRRNHTRIEAAQRSGHSHAGGSRAENSFLYCPWVCMTWPEFYKV